VTNIGAVDIGGTKIAVGAVTHDGNILARTECATAPQQGFAIAMQRIKAMLNEVADRADVTLDGIGIASPGPLDPISGVLHEVGTLPGWQGGNLVAELTAEFGTRIAVENDADAGALAEATHGAGKGSSRLIYITVSTGIGGGILFEGQIYRGASGAHPELGHQIIDASGPLCYCGARGCWESLASGSAIASWVQEQRPAPTPRPAEEIALMASQGDSLALQAMDREGYYLGLGLANVLALFAPETIVLGGGVMKSSRYFMTRALKVIDDVCTQVPVKNTHIVHAALGEATGLVGAAQVWLRRFGYP
jgi:glucokinase